MAKVHPNAAAVAAGPATPTARAAAVQDPKAPPTVLTVWRKSLLFNGDGFTVYDARGDLAFRVDCYAASRRRAEVVLMDAAGAPLLTVRRKRLSLAERWLVYDGDAAGSGRLPLLSVHRHVGLHSSGGKTLARTSSPRRPRPPAARRSWSRAPTAAGPAPCATCSGLWWVPASARRSRWGSSSPSTRCSPAAAPRARGCAGHAR